MRNARNAPYCSRYVGHARTLAAVVPGLSFFFTMHRKTSATNLCLFSIGHQNASCKCLRTPRKRCRGTREARCARPGLSVLLSTPACGGVRCSFALDRALCMGQVSGAASGHGQRGAVSGERAYQKVLNVFLCSTLMDGLAGLAGRTPRAWVN